MLRIATVNVNGVRAAFRKGMGEWLEKRDLDVVTLQEVRAPDEIVHELLAETGYHVAHTEAAAKGRAGVAVLSRIEPDAIRIGNGDDYFDDAGRWIETDLALPNGDTLTVVSVYVHSGEVGTPRQDDKYRFLDQMSVRLAELSSTRNHAVVTGDLNVGHTELDIKNWKGNIKKAGFLPEERAYFDRFFGELGWVDVHRKLVGDVPGPYTWWSMRGQAFDNDAGWRIDYQMATPVLAESAREAVVDRALSYDTRWSDHAPLVIDYEI
ncbi:MAG: exodeoxyribonuclease III [Actinomycetales bacterium]|nr:exodeoxyribonuclease III [Actinomycetales bacterium]